MFTNLRPGRYAFQVRSTDSAGLETDAVINSAYILIGLHYGGKDFGKTIDIATRCGQDSDCNPSSAGGILGTILGYSAIPDEWK